MTKRARECNFSFEEKDLLTDLIAQKFRNVIENKKTDTVSQKEKDAAWLELTKIFINQSGKKREVNSLKTCWANLKRKTRTAFAEEKTSNFKTGGGPESKKISDPIFIKVQQLLSCTLDGLSNPYDDDTEYNEGFNNEECDEDIIATGLDEINEIVATPETVPLFNLTNWAQYSPALLRTSLSSELHSRKKLHFEKECNPKVAVLSVIEDNGQKKNTAVLEGSVSNILNNSTTDTPRNDPVISRRRPTYVKDSTEMLLDNKNELALLAKQNAFAEEERKIELHKLQVENEKRKKEFLEILIANEKKKADVLNVKLLEKKMKVELMQLNNKM